MNTPTQQTGGEAATPRTDAAESLVYEGCNNGIWMVGSDFARQLERETATRHAQIARLQQREGELIGALKEVMNETDSRNSSTIGQDRAYAIARAALQSVAKPAPIQREQHFIVDKKPEYPCELYGPKCTSWHHFYSFDALSGELDHGWTMWRKSVAKEGETK